MTINDCISAIHEPFKKLFDASVDKQKKAASKDKYRFSWYDLQENLRPIINERLATKEERAMPDTRRNACRT